MKKKEHLSFFGCGPVYGAIIITLTVLGAIAGGQSLLSGGRVLRLGWLFRPLGIALILIGIVIYRNAPSLKGFRDKYNFNTLVTERFKKKQTVAENTDRGEEEANND